MTKKTNTKKMTDYIEMLTDASTLYTLGRFSVSKCSK